MAKIGFKVASGGYEDFQRGLESIGQQRTDGKKSTKLTNNKKITNEELITKVRELEENQIRLLESLPQIIKNVIIKQTKEENE